MKAAFIAAFFIFGKLIIVAHAIMPARRLLTLSVMLTVVSGYLYFFQDQRYLIWGVIIGVLFTMTAYIFQHQINWLWYTKYPPPFPAEMEQMYAFRPDYAALSPSEKSRFRSRARMYVEAAEFIAQGFESVAEDIKYMIAYYAVLVSLGKEDYLYRPYQRVVFYLHPFLSPNLPDTIHTYEIENEDGTLIFSLEQLTAGFLKPMKYYQTGLHVFAELFVMRFLKNAPGPDEAIWQQIEQAGGWSKQAITEYTGMADPDPRAVLIHQYYLQGSGLQQQAPDLYALAEGWLKTKSLS